MFRRKRKFEDFSAEVESHLALEIQRLCEQGLSYEEARAAAHRAFGNVTKAQERFYESGRWMWWDHLWQDLRFAVRMLRKSPGFTTVAVLTLALGIGAATGIFSVVDAVLIHDLPFRNPGRLVALFQTPGKSTGLIGWAADGPDILDWQRESHSLSEISASLLTGANISGGAIPQHVNGERVTANYFELLGVQAGIGRTFSPSDERSGAREVVISYALWQAAFGGQDILGHTVELDAEPFTVVGVMPATYHDPRTWSNPQSDYWLLWPQSQLAQNRGEHMYASFGRLAPHATLAQAQQELNVIALRDANVFPDTNKGFGVRVSPLDQVNLQVFEGGHFESVGPAVLVLQLAAGFLLLVACANIAGLMLSRSVNRHREFAVRAAIGAGRARMIRQLLTESVLLSITGGAGGVLFAYWCAKALVALAPKGYLPPTAIIHVDVQVLVFALAVSTLIGILFGLAPALRASRANLTEDLKSTPSILGASPSRLRGRRSLVVFELAATFVLLIAAGLMVRSLASLLNVNPGFESRDFFTAGINLPLQQYAKPDQLLEFFVRVQRHIAALPGISAVAFTSAPEFGVTSASDVIIEGELPATKNGTAGVWPQICVVSPDFFRAAGIPLLRGRAFTPSDGTAGTHVAVITEAFARQFWPHQEALGKHVRCCGIPGWLNVVGVVGDVHQEGLAAQPRPELYFPLTRETADGQNSMNVVVRSSLPPAILVREVAEQVGKVDAAIPLSDIKSGRNIIDDWSSTFRYRATLVGSFGVMSLLIAAIGLFGTISYVTAQRGHEIGLRMALGAQRGSVFRLIIFEGTKLTIIGLVIGFVGALVLARFIASLVYGVTASDPITFAGVAVMLMAVALVACYIPARRAMRVDPMAALRHE
jgi:predicted permease